MPVFGPPNAVLKDERIVRFPPGCELEIVNVPPLLSVTEGAVAVPPSNTTLWPSRSSVAVGVPVLPIRIERVEVMPAVVCNVPPLILTIEGTEAPNWASRPKERRR